MKSYHYEINGFMKGCFVAKNRWDAKRYCKQLAKRFCPNIKIKSIKLTRLKDYEPLATVN